MDKYTVYFEEQDDPIDKITIEADSKKDALKRVKEFCKKEPILSGLAPKEATLKEE